MIDIKFLRENPEAVKENIKKKFQDSKLPLVDEVIALDEESRKTKQEADDLRANRNKLSKEIGALMEGGGRSQEGRGCCRCQETGRTGRERKETGRKGNKDHDGNSQYHRSQRSNR